jgi:CBS domain-containing protein
MSLVKTHLKAKDVMTPDPVCVTPSTRLRELARLFEEHEISGVPVVDQQGRVVGVVSKSDLIRRCSEGTDDVPPAYLFEVLAEQGDEDEISEIMPEQLVCVQDLMTEGAVTVGPGQPVVSVARLMAEKRVHRVVVTDGSNLPIGIITSLDLLGAFAHES